VLDKTQQQAAMERIDRETKAGKRKWLIVMIAIIAVVTGISVGVFLWNMEYGPYALIFFIVGNAIAAKLCMAQVGKVLERQRAEREKLDTGGTFSRFDL